MTLAAIVIAHLSACGIGWLIELIVYALRDKSRDVVFLAVLMFGTIPVFAGWLLLGWPYVVIMRRYEKQFALPYSVATGLMLSYLPFLIVPSLFGLKAIKAFLGVWQLHVFSALIGPIWVTLYGLALRRQAKG